MVQAFLESHPEFEQVKLEHECKDILKDDCILITPNYMEVMDSLLANFVRYPIRKELTQWRRIITRCGSEV